MSVFSEFLKCAIDPTHVFNGCDMPGCRQPGTIRITYPLPPAFVDLLPGNYPSFGEAQACPAHEPEMRRRLCPQIR